MKGDEVVAMSFDRMGRRVAKNNQRFVYDGYLQIADNGGNAYVWDPTESVATRPLVWNRGGEVSYYAHDGNKNVSDVVASNGAVVAHYDYAPFGAVIAQSGALASANPFGFSSEYADRDLGLVYYNYRHYNPVTGRWLSRDPIEEEGGIALYGWCGNNGIMGWDKNGNVLIVPMTIAIPAIIVGSSALGLALSSIFDDGNGMVRIYGKRKGVMVLLKEVISPMEFIDKLNSFDDCSVESVEFDGHANESVIFPFNNEDYSHALEWTETDGVSGPGDLVVSVESGTEVSISDILVKKMKKGGSVSFKGCRTASGIKNMVRSLSSILKDVKVTGNVWYAVDIRKLFGWEFRPWCPVTSTYVNGEEHFENDSYNPFEYNPFFSPLR